MLFKMMYSMSLFNNICVLEPLGRELHTNMNTNALENILPLLLYSSFVSFVNSFQHIKSPKCINLF
jgi:hypothetical protein